MRIYVALNWRNHITNLEKHTLRMIMTFKHDKRQD